MYRSCGLMQLWGRSKRNLFNKSIIWAWSLCSRINQGNSSTAIHKALPQTRNVQFMRVLHHNLLWGCDLMMRMSGSMDSSTSRRPESFITLISWRKLHLMDAAMFQKLSTRPQQTWHCQQSRSWSLWFHLNIRMLLYLKSYKITERAIFLADLLLFFCCIVLKDLQMKLQMLSLVTENFTPIGAKSWIWL